MSLLSVSTSSTLNALFSSDFYGYSARYGARTRDAMAEGGVNVDLDASLFVQVGLFVILLVVLKPLLFEPMLKLFEEREKRIEGTRREASKEDERSAKALAKYESIVAKAREAGTQERDALRAEGARKEAELMATVRAMTTTTVEQGRSNIARETKSVRDELAVSTTELSHVIAARVLGREVSS